MENQMDSSKNAPVFYGASNNGTEGALLAGLAMKDNGYNESGMLGASGVCDLRYEVGHLAGIIKDSASNIRADIGDVKADLLREGQDNIKATLENRSAILMKLGDVECKVIKENSDQTLYLTNQLSVIREQGIRNEFETKLSREAVIKEVSAKLDHEAERTNDKIAHGFADIKDVVKHGFFHAREEGLEEKNFKLSQDLQTANLARLICCDCNESSAPGNSGK